MKHYIYMITTAMVACSSTMPRAETVKQLTCYNEAGAVAQALVDELCPEAKAGCEGFHRGMALLEKELMKCDQVD